MGVLDLSLPRPGDAVTLTFDPDAALPLDAPSAVDRTAVPAAV